MNQSDYDRQALVGAAEYLEQLATGGNSAPLAFSQAIRRAASGICAQDKIDGEVLSALRMVSGLDLHHDVLRVVDEAIYKATNP